MRCSLIVILQISHRFDCRFIAAATAAVLLLNNLQLNVKIGFSSFSALLTHNRIYYIHCFLLLLSYMHENISCFPFRRIRVSFPTCERLLYIFFTEKAKSKHKVDWEKKKIKNNNNEAK